MVLPRGKGGGLKPAKPSLIMGGKSTQRIVLPGRSEQTRSVAAPSTPAGNLELPVGILVRNMPEEALAASREEVLETPEAQTSVNLPLQLILPQLPSGRVVLRVADVHPHLPASVIKQSPEIDPLLDLELNLPLMDVVMRIPPDLLALRPDQKDVDAAVKNMADPFTEEVLREAAQKAATGRLPSVTPPAAPPAPAATPAAPKPPAMDMSMATSTLQLPKMPGGAPPPATGSVSAPPPPAPAPAPPRPAAPPAPVSITPPPPAPPLPMPPAPGAKPPTVPVPNPGAQAAPPPRPAPPKPAAFAPPPPPPAPAPEPEPEPEPAFEMADPFSAEEQADPFTAEEVTEEEQTTEEITAEETAVPTGPSLAELAAMASAEEGDEETPAEEEAAYDEEPQPEEEAGPVPPPPPAAAKTTVPRAAIAAAETKALEDMPKPRVPTKAGDTATMPKMPRATTSMPSITPPPAPPAPPAPAAPVEEEEEASIPTPAQLTGSLLPPRPAGGPSKPTATIPPPPAPKPSTGAPPPPPVPKPMSPTTRVAIPPIPPRPPVPTAAQAPAPPAPPAPPKPAVSFEAPKPPMPAAPKPVLSAPPAPPAPPVEEPEEEKAEAPAPPPPPAPKPMAFAPPPPPKPPVPAEEKEEEPEEIEMQAEQPETVLEPETETDEPQAAEEPEASEEADVIEEPETPEEPQAPEEPEAEEPKAEAPPAPPKPPVPPVPSAFKPPMPPPPMPKPPVSVVAPPKPVAPRPAAVTSPVQEDEDVEETMAPVDEAPQDKPETAPSEDINLNQCSAEELAEATGAPRALAEAIVRYRKIHGDFESLEDLMKVPGITPLVYSMLTGADLEGEPAYMTLQQLLGFPKDQELTLKDVTDRIACWPDVVGCVLGQSTGLPLVGTVPDGVDMRAIVAFAPKLFTGLNQSFKEFSGTESDEIVIPTEGTSYHILRRGELFLVIMSSQQQMPKRHLEVARFVLSSIDAREHQ